MKRQFFLHHQDYCHLSKNMSSVSSKRVFMKACLSTNSCWQLEGFVGTKYVNVLWRYMYPYEYMYDTHYSIIQEIINFGRLTLAQFFPMRYWPIFPSKLDKMILFFSRYWFFSDLLVWCYCF